MSDTKKPIRLVDVGELEKDLRQDLAEEEAKGEAAPVTATSDEAFFRAKLRISEDGPREVTEMCPNCDREVTMLWDVKEDGYKAACPYCGGRLMLCDECQHPNGEYVGDCDYNQESDTCRYNCETNCTAAETVVKSLSDVCKVRVKRASNLKKHSACIGCGYEPLCSKWSGANTPVMWTFKENSNESNL